MKKIAWIIMLVVLFAGTSLVFAEGKKEGMKGKEMVGGGMMKGDKMDKGGKMTGMMEMNHMMMQSMMQKQVVATEDGGIIVVAGNKLTKYDKDLNVVKEVELKMDMEGMQKMMEHMKGMCPMMDKGMMGGMKEGSSKGNTVSESTKTVEHTIHHTGNK